LFTLHRNVKDMSIQIKQFDIVELLEDLNEIIKKGMVGCVLEVWDEETVEVEFVKNDGSNFEHEGQVTFPISKNKLKIIE